VRLGLTLGYQTNATSPAQHLALTQEADRLGYAVVWAAEAYGSDSPSMLAWLAGQTERIDVGAAVMQIPARTPAATAMTAATIDAASGGPQVSEGWHGVRFAQPLERTREYVAIVRMALARQRVEYPGDHYRLPLPDGPGKALKLGFHPPRGQVPIYLAAIGPKNLHLTGEIADGWLPIFFSPEHSEDQLAQVRAGAAAAGRDLADFDVAASVPVVIGDDVAACADLVRGYAALYLGGMGSRRQNFYHRLATRMGYGAAADQVQELYLSGRHRDAAAAVPQEFIDRTSLLGPTDRIADRLQAYAQSGVTTLSVSLFTGDPQAAREALRTVVAAAERAGIGG
jgi:F420-dependent oxidoreductase-like protein